MTAPILFACGMFTKNTGAEPTASNTVTCTAQDGSTFQPKVVLLWCAGAQANNTAEGTGYGIPRQVSNGFGFTDFSTPASVGAGMQQSGTPSDAARRIATAGLSIPLPDASAVDFECDVTTTATGFKCTWVENNSKTIRIHWAALGGDGLQYHISEWDSPTTATFLDIGGCSFTPKAAIHIMSRSTSRDGLTAGAQHGIGAMDGTDQWYIAVRSQDNVDPSNTNRHQVDDRCIGHVTGSIQVDAHFTSWKSDGCRITFDTNVPGVACKGATLFLGGDSLLVQAGTWAKTAADPTDRIDVAFPPVGIFFGTQVAPTAASPRNDADMGIGFAVNGGDQTGSEASDHDGDSPPATFNVVYSSNQSALVMVTHSSQRGTVSDWFTDGFEVTWSPMSSSLDLVAYLAFGVQIVPTPAALVLTASTPTVSQSNPLLSPAAAALTLTGTTPVLDTKLTPSARALVITGSVPTVSVTSGSVTTIGPSPADLIITLSTPAVTAGTTETLFPDAAGLILTGLTPTVAGTGASVDRARRPGSARFVRPGPGAGRRR